MRLLNSDRSQTAPKKRGLLSGLITVGGVLLLATALLLTGYNASMALTPGSTTFYDANLLTWALGALAVGVALLARHKLPGVGRGVLGGLARVLGFPVVYIKDNAWPTYFTIVGGGLVYALACLYMNMGSTFTLVVLSVSALAGAAGGLYHLLQHRWASSLALGVAAVLVLVGVSLLNHRSRQVEAYNVAMQANAAHDWEAQNKLLEASIAAYEQDLKSRQLFQLIFPAPSSDTAALAHFHRANGLLQSPAKGKEAFNELCKSLMRNPGNRYHGITAEEAAKREDEARHAQRNLEKLIRSGQEGGAGQPNGKQGQGQQQGKGKQPSRDPGKEPQPGSGRQPRNSL